jgi:hypothetical protein
MDKKKMSISEKKAVFFIVLVGFLFSLIGTFQIAKRTSLLDGVKLPEWIQAISAPAVKDESELDKLWLSRKRCCIESEVIASNQELYKACADAIKSHPNDEDLVVKCLWLMPSADSGNKLDIYRLLLLKYPNHKDSLANCENCKTGDTISRATKEVAVYDASTGDPDKLESAIKMLEDVLDKRGEDTSAWVKLEIYKELGELYLRSGVTESRKKRINAAYKELDVVRIDQSLSSRIEEFEKVGTEINSVISVPME